MNEMHISKGYWLFFCQTWAKQSRKTHEKKSERDVCALTQKCACVLCILSLKHIDSTMQTKWSIEWAIEAKRRWSDGCRCCCCTITTTLANGTQKCRLRLNVQTTCMHWCVDVACVCDTDNQHSTAWIPIWRVLQFGWLREECMRKSEKQRKKNVRRDRPTSIREKSLVIHTYLFINVFRSFFSRVSSLSTQGWVGIFHFGCIKHMHTYVSVRACVCVSACMHGTHERRK